MSILDGYKNKRVLVTGHTGFKGTWLCHILKQSGAIVCGVSLKPNTNPALFDLARGADGMESHIQDIRDYDALLTVFHTFKPEIVFHLAAQPIVRESYKNPRDTYETNVMGTVNLMECVRQTPSVRSVLNVTTDKVYENKEWCWGYRENEPLDGFDPYSNSKSCSELVTHSYTKSFFNEMGINVSTARAGNVIGGGDFSVDRIIPDCVRATVKRLPIQVRNPNSVRPYQHVLEPLFAYMMIALRQLSDSSFSGSYNVGPNEESCVTTGELVGLFVKDWGGTASWSCGNAQGPHEANFLKLDCSKIKNKFGWKPQWDIKKALEETVEWYRVWNEKGNIVSCMDKQIKEYLEKKNA
jgi:CDP-glucose 4,6-dehydratase